MAFAILPPGELPFYVDTKEFLSGTTLDQLFAPACVVNKITYPFGIGTSSPFLLLFKKKDPMAHFPMHVTMLFWKNYVFQYSIPYHSADTEHFAGKQLVTLQLPPFFFFEAKNVDTSAVFIHLASATPLKGEKEVFSFSYDPSIPLEAYNSETGEWVEEQFDPGKVSGIHMSKGDNFLLPIKKEPPAGQ